ncbi:MAG: tRNA-(ms[2]io[6]A)-hydroxylase, partial [Enterobacteriaceae bacterium]
DLAALAGKSRGLSRKIEARADVPYAPAIIDKMVLLIKEELHHFYQVLEIMVQRNIAYNKISPGRYARGMMQHVRHHEPAALVDKLICGAFIEARSCERFAKLAPHLDEELQHFYLSLLRSEARHYEDYLQLAQLVNGADIRERVELFAQVEAELILSPDEDFKFHSGLPCDK